MLINTEEWKLLSAHYHSMKNTQLRELQDADGNRFKQFSLEAAGITLDYSNNHCDKYTRQLLCKLAKRCDLPIKIQNLFSGIAINQSENQPALHTALRDFSSREVFVDNENILKDLPYVWKKMEKIVNNIRSGHFVGFSGKPIKHIINIGIGGSDLGPKMAANALKHLIPRSLSFYFVSNLDEHDLKECLDQCDPETTLFIVSSKSFTTHETLSNLRIARQWLSKEAGNTAFHQIIAVTSNVGKALASGFINDNILPFWHWVGGRYSIWSPVSLSLAIAIGIEQFKEFLLGANKMDQHFLSQPLDKNMPVILGMIGVWVNNFFNFNTHAVIVYYQRLKFFPEYLQQLFMESLGKSIGNDGAPIKWQTGGILWGGVGTNTQHSFHQLLLQGTQTVPTDFIFPIQSYSDKANHEEMIANCLAQSEVFCRGYQGEQNHKTIRGNIPHNIIMLDEMRPACLGALIALYEHKAYVQSAIWDINPFDQWGVERGKVIMPSILQKIRKTSTNKANDFKGVVALISRRMNE